MEMTQKDLMTRVMKLESGCWEWQMYVDNNGYGQVWVGKQRWKAHRLAWTLFNGAIPPGIFVCHKCDNGACCNPEHLFLGSHKDNMRDMAEKGRAYPYRLTDEQVIGIRERYAAGGVSANALAKECGVSCTALVGLLRGELRKYTGGPIGYRGRCIGQERSQAKLNDQKVREIRRRKEHGESSSKLANVYGVSPSLIRKMLRGEIWSHVI